MSSLDKFTYLGGIKPVPFEENENCESCNIRYTCKYRKTVDQLEKIREYARNSWKKRQSLSQKFHSRLRGHLSRKQDTYLPVLIAIILLVMVFVSKTAFSKTIDQTNHLPVEDTYKVKLIGTTLTKQPKVLAATDKKNAKTNAKTDGKGDQEDLKSDVEKIVQNTPMAAMVDSIAQKPRPVAAFIVGIAMKESKFGVYSPKMAGRDCYNYWGFKGGGKTTSGGYSCFSSPEDAVNAVGNKIEKMVAKGVRTPAQAISWKCGSSCAGHGEENVRKWISDVAINYYKINS